MSYTGEFRAHWPNLLGATLGLALGAALNHYMLNLFGPPLLEEFGWEKSQFALVGALSLAAMVFVPVAGYLADRLGPRISLIIGFTAVPLAFVAFSLMSGSIYQFYAIILFMNTFGVLTTTLVMARIVVERFDAARGMALSVLMSGAPLIGATCVPIVGYVIETEGWRTGYLILAGASAVGGLAAILLTGRRRGGNTAAAEDKPKRTAPPITRQAFFEIVRQPVFIFLIGGMLLCNLPQVIVHSQMNLVLMDNGATMRFATWLVSLYAISVVVGRFITGFALDRWPSHIIAFVALGLPALGLAIIASPFTMSWLLAFSIILIGLAQGAEGDVGAFITSRRFPLENYSFVYSFLIASMGAASAIGSIVLSVTLSYTGSYNLFLTLAAVATMIGAFFFYLTGWTGRQSAMNGQQPQTV